MTIISFFEQVLSISFNFLIFEINTLLCILWCVVIAVVSFRSFIRSNQHFANNIPWSQQASYTLSMRFVVTYGMQTVILFIYFRTFMIDQCFENFVTLQILKAVCKFTQKIAF